MSDPFAGRITELNGAEPRQGRYVLYWMQRAQRGTGNHALEYAVRQANRLKLPVVVGFGLMRDYPEATERHFRFMLEGLVETAERIRGRGMAFVLRPGHPAEVAVELAREAAIVVCDRGYLRHHREWRFRVGRECGCRAVEVETDLIVPVEAASLKQEYAARTIRPRIHRLLGRYLLPLPEEQVQVRAYESTRMPAGEPTDGVDSLLARLNPSPDPGPVSAFFRGGYSEARRRLDHFATHSLERYELARNEPSSDVASGLSPYLHFGQISSLEIALGVGAENFVSGLESGSATMKTQPGSVGLRVSEDPRESSRDAFLEELLVRRGLAHNFVWFAPDYDSYQAVPAWARRSLEDHAGDTRPAEYDQDELIRCETVDEHWNNAMTEMLVTGTMHNYMRMYWAKKILEWTRTPQSAFEAALSLNNRYFLDGRDPNSYANVAWTFGLHDRPWTERPVFGKVRYMNANGLRRKFDMDAYALKIRRLSGQART